MTDSPEKEAVGRLRDNEDEHAARRLVETPAWVRPLGALITVALIVGSVLAAIKANPW